MELMAEMARFPSASERIWMVFWPAYSIIQSARSLVYLHLYFDDQKAVDDKTVFNALLDTLEEEIMSNRRTPEHETLYQKYYDISTTPVRGTVIVPKQEAISTVEKDYGYFVLLSNDIKDHSIFEKSRMSLMIDLRVGEAVHIEGRAAPGCRMHL